MNNYKILYKLKNFIILCSILFLYNIHNVIAEIKQEDIIAVVDDNPILYKEISINKNMVSVMTKNEEEKNKTMLELEKKQLSLMIMKTIEQSLIKRFNIYMSPEEEKLFIKEYLKQKNIMPQINTLMEERVYPVIEALEECLKIPNESDKIYRKYLSAIINKEQWDIYLKLYNSKEKIEKLKVISKISEENIENKILPLLREDSLRKKLSEVIIQNTIITDEELNNFYNRKYKDKKEKPAYNEIINKLKIEYINENRKSILTKEWREYILKCNIEMKHKDFSDVLEYIKENHLLK